MLGRIVTLGLGFGSGEVIDTLDASSPYVLVKWQDNGDVEMELLDDLYTID